MKKKRINVFFIDKQTTRKSKSKQTHTHDSKFSDCLQNLQKPFFTIATENNKK